MKKIIKTIKLRKLKTEVNKESFKPFENQEFVVVFEDNTCERVYYKKDLISILEKDHIKKVWYIFDMVDRIIVDRNVDINISV